MNAVRLIDDMASANPHLVAAQVRRMASDLRQNLVTSTFLYIGRLIVY